MYYMLNLMFFVFLIFLFLASSKIPKMVILTIILVIFLSNMLFMVSVNSWISMSMFLSLVGGLMILFSLVASIFPSRLEQSNSILISLGIVLLLEFLVDFNMGELIVPVNVTYSIEIIFFLISILNFCLLMISKMIFFNEKLFRFSFSQLKLVS